MPLALGIIVSYLSTGPVLKDMDNRKKIRKYLADKCAFMANLSAKYLEEAKCKLALDRFVKVQLQEVQICLEQINVHIPKLIKADKMLCKQLMDEKRNPVVICNVYKPSLEEFSKLRGDLALFGFKEVFGNISRNELEWKEDAFHRLSIGSYDCAYKGMMNKGGDSQHVALKVWNQELSDDNANDVVAEVKLLR